MYAEGEAFANLGSHTYDSRLRRIFWKQPKRITAKGFKIFYYHPLDRESPELWQYLEAMTDLRIIHLTRENTLRTLLSRKIAAKQNLWTGTRFDANDSPNSKVVRFTPAELEKGFQETQDWIDEANRRFRNHKVLAITYEELVGATDVTFRKVQDHLGLDYSDPCSTLQKQNPENLSVLIENYFELKEHFASTEWARYFTE